MWQKHNVQNSHATNFQSFNDKCHHDSIQGAEFGASVAFTDFHADGQNSHLWARVQHKQWPSGLRTVKKYVGQDDWPAIVFPPITVMSHASCDANWLKLTLTSFSLRSVFHFTK